MIFRSRRNRSALPLPPLEMRRLVGRVQDRDFDNPSGALVIPGITPERYRAVLDFGCGCGRLARQLIQQRPRPERYAGIDLHPGMVRWCQDNLAPHAPGFTFHHHDVHYEAFNPGPDKPLWRDFPFGDDEFTLVLAQSVFTHLTQDQAEHYLAETARVLTHDGLLESTWFLFDKRDFPMMQSEQNTLFINPFDVRNAVIYDREWLVGAAADAGLTVCAAEPPEIRGFHWRICLTPSRPGISGIDIPADTGDFGHKPPPPMPDRPERIGLTSDE